MYERIPRKHAQQKIGCCSVHYSTAGPSVLIKKSLLGDFSPSMSVTQ